MKKNYLIALILLLIVLIVIAVIVIKPKETKEPQIKVTTTIKPEPPKVLTNPDECKDDSCKQTASANEALLTNNVGQCNSAPNPQECADKFLKDQAYLNLDVVGCNKISSQDTRTSCRDEIYYAQSKRFSDKNYCNLIADLILKETCLK